MSSSVDVTVLSPTTPTSTNNKHVEQQQIPLVSAAPAAEDVKKPVKEDLIEFDDKEKMPSAPPPGFENMPKPTVSTSAASADIDMDTNDLEESAKEESGTENVSSTSSSLGVELESAAAAASDNNPVQQQQHEDCSICLNQMNKDEVLWELDKCKHKFHWICIDEWLKRNSSCPLCQTRYGPPKGNQPPGQMNIRTVPYQNVPGFQDSKGYIEISYSIPSGIQGVS